MLFNDAREGKAASGSAQLNLGTLMMQTQIFSLICAMLLLTSLHAHAGNLSPVGRWITFDEDTGEPQAIIEIRSHGGRLYGWIDKILSAPADAEPARCTECEGKLKNAPVLGFKIIRNMRFEGGEWHGHIINPETAKVHNATLSITDKGQRLDVRGYISIPLFGRTQTWERTQ